MELHHDITPAVAFWPSQKTLDIKLYKKRRADQTWQQVSVYYEKRKLYLCTPKLIMPYGIRPTRAKFYRASSDKFNCALLMSKSTFRDALSKFEQVIVDKIVRSQLMLGADNIKYNMFQHVKSSRTGEIKTLLNCVFWHNSSSSHQTQIIIHDPDHELCPHLDPFSISRESLGRLIISPNIIITDVKQDAKKIYINWTVHRLTLYPKPSVLPVGRCIFHDDDDYNSDSDDLDAYQSCEDEDEDEDEKVVSNTIKQYGFCAVCQDRPAWLVLKPCNHHCSCNECFIGIRKHNNSCPICRAEIVTAEIFNPDEIKGVFEAVINY